MKEGIVMSLLFNIAAVLMIAFSVSVISMLRKTNTRLKSVNIQEELSVLRKYSDGATSPQKVSSAVVSLFHAPYYFIHILTNKGENYDDQLQLRSYLSSLTDRNLKIINSIEGHYE